MSLKSLDSSDYEIPVSSMEELKEILDKLSVTISVIEQSTHENQKENKDVNRSHRYSCCLGFKGKDYDATVCLGFNNKNTIRLTFERQEEEHIADLEEALSSKFKLKSSYRSGKGAPLLGIYLTILFILIIASVFLYGLFSIIVKVL